MTYHILTYIDTNVIILAFVTGVLGVSMFMDIKTNKIPNSITLSSTIILIILLLIFIPIKQFPQHIESFIIAFVLFSFLFYKGWIGGGDAKLFMFTCLAFPVYVFLSLLIWIFIIGGFQALFTKFLLKNKHSLPYSVSIFFGTISYILTSFLLNT